MDRSNGARSRAHPAKSGSSPVNPTRTPTVAPVRIFSEHAWANANRAWMVAYRLAAAKR